MSTGNWQPSPAEEKPPALWDPLNAWPAGRKWIWAILAIFMVAAQGRPFLQSLRVNWGAGNDFFQDWASARNVLEGRPAYLLLSDALSLYYPKAQGGREPAPTFTWNAHPPTSVLAVIPLGLLDYPEAGILWSILGLAAFSASLALILRELRFPVAAWSIFPVVALGLSCSPLRNQIIQGQWSAQLLLLLTLAWVAHRRGHNAWAGFWVGTAAALKLFPIFFLVYFAVLRHWRAVIAGAAWTLASSAATVAVLGVDAYRDYATRVLPTLRHFQSGWVNASILGFWLKDFVTGAEHYGMYAEPVVSAPLLACAGVAVSLAAVIAVWYFYVNKLRVNKSPRYQDLGYSLTVVTVLLLSPICWDHYLLLLAMPLAIIWAGLGRSTLQRCLFLMLVLVLWVNPMGHWRLGGVDLVGDWPDFDHVPPRTYIIHRPLFSLLFLSLHFYALVASYLWLIFLARRELAASRQ
jgi:hypothetical protein